MWANFKAEWRPWWRGLNWRQRLLPALVAVGHLVAVGMNGPEALVHLLLASAFLFAYYGLPAKRVPFEFVLPLYLGWLAFTGFQMLPSESFSRVHGLESWEIDRKFFSFSGEDKSVTPTEFLGQWGGDRLRLLCRFILPLVLPLTILMSGLIRFRYSRKGTQNHSAWGVELLSSQINWAILGLGVVSLIAFWRYPSLSPAALESLGKVVSPTLPPFRLRSAMPASAVGFAALAAYYAFKFGVLRSVASAMIIVVLLAAIRSMEHFAIDCLFGIVLAIVVAGFVDTLWDKRAKSRTKKVWKPTLPQADRPAKPRPSRKVAS